MDSSLHVGRDAIREGAAFDRHFVITNVAATIIACCGLIGDSGGTIIGAMVVATLASVVMSIGLALIERDDELLVRSLRTLLLGTLLVLSTSLIMGVLLRSIPPTHELLIRTEANPFDLIVALTSGATGAYFLAGQRRGLTIVGVAIAVQVVPPLATAGMFLSRGDATLGAGALYLAAVNIVGIQVGASVALWLCGIRGEARKTRGFAWLPPEILSFALMIALAISTGVHTVRVVRKGRFEVRTRDVLADAVGKYPGAQLADVEFSREASGEVVTAVVRSAQRFTPDDVARIEKQLPEPPRGRGLRLRLRHVEVEVLSSGG